MSYTLAASRRRRRGRFPLIWIGLLIPAFALVYHLYLEAWQVRGQVVDLETGQPVAGVRIDAPRTRAQSDEAGVFQLASVRPGESLALNADGYHPVEVGLGWDPHVEVALRPRTFRLRVLDAETREPIEAEVRWDKGTPRSQGKDGYILSPAPPSTTLSVIAKGYLPAEVRSQGQEQLEVALRPLYRGRVRSAATGEPVLGARVVVDGRILQPNGRGEFEVPGRPVSPRATVLAPGFQKGEIDFTRRDSLDVALKPMVAKGVYLTFFGVGNAELRGNVMRMLETTELNTVVIDVKGDRGWIAYPSAVPLAEKIGANDVHTLSDVDQLLQTLKQRGVYTIARLVVFKDDLLARNGASAGVDVAIKNSQSGGPWIDGEGLGWVDPYREQVWEYNIALAVEAARKGFDEIQFDYVRFPTDPSADSSLELATYSRPSTERNRVDALVGFLSRARDEMHRAGAFLSIDTYGYTCFIEDDLGIGQDLARLAPYVDYISPMVYPSTYNAGIPGTITYPAVVRRPYEVVYESMRSAQQRIAGSGTLLRPWLQYFDDYPWATGFAYDAPQIVAQQMASEEANALGWLFWDPTNLYERGGFLPKGGGQLSGAGGRG